jgi:hypothetical protein
MASALIINTGDDTYLKQSFQVMKQPVVQASREEKLPSMFRTLTGRPLVEPARDPPWNALERPWNALERCRGK